MKSVTYRIQNQQTKLQFLHSNTDLVDKKDLAIHPSIHSSTHTPTCPFNKKFSWKDKRSQHKIYTTLVKETEDLNKWKDIIFLQTGKISILIMQSYQQIQSKYQWYSSKIIHHKSYMAPQKTHYSPCFSILAWSLFESINVLPHLKMYYFWKYRHTYLVKKNKLVIW